ncbi:MAG TPA: mycofactocin-coupled SDR family oxidoreductase [Jatrophihabitantaceae bacterium]|jgi:SDR family mycofactocin-dependent oxidoreductase
MGRVDGKVAVITGAARGQGRSHAVRLAEEGASVALIDICAPIAQSPYPLASREDLEETRRMVLAAGGRAITRVADIRVQAELDGAIADTVAEFGRLDVVVENAGIVDYHPLHEIPEDVFTTVVDVNLGGTWRTLKAVIPHLVAQAQGGSIILTSSVAGMKGMQHLGHYCATKHGIVGLMRVASLELAAHGIRVNTVNPGGVLTPMIDNDLTRMTFRPDLSAPTLADMGEVSKTLHSMGIPWLDPIDVSNAILFLASDEARYVTGVVFPVDAGMS